MKLKNLILATAALFLRDAFGSAQSSDILPTIIDLRRRHHSFRSYKFRQSDIGWPNTNRPAVVDAREAQFFNWYAEGGVPIRIYLFRHKPDFRTPTAAVPRAQLSALRDVPRYVGGRPSSGTSRAPGLVNGAGRGWVDPARRFIPAWDDTPSILILFSPETGQNRCK